MNYDTSQFRKGLRIEIDDHPYIMVEAQFVKPGKGQAFTRVKIKSLLTGAVLDRTYKSGEKVKGADISEQTMQFLYATDDTFHFMNNDTYDQVELNREQMGESEKWIQEETLVEIVFYKGRAVSVSPPNFVVMEVTYCEPGIRGDTATNTTKPATLSSGVVVQVPLFVNQGEKIKVDTRACEYVERVKG